MSICYSVEPEKGLKNKRLEAEKVFTLCPKESHADFTNILSHMYDTALLLVLAYTMWVIDRKQIGIEKHWYPKLVFKAIRPLLLTEQPHSQLHSDPEIRATFKKYFCKKLPKSDNHTRVGLNLGLFKTCNFPSVIENYYNYITGVPVLNCLLFKLCINPWL